jgi:hypothetical protein
MHLCLTSVLLDRNTAKCFIIAKDKITTFTCIFYACVIIVCILATPRRVRSSIKENRFGDN